jgi:hypothetical protein
VKEEMMQTSEDLGIQELFVAEGQLLPSIQYESYFRGDEGLESTRPTSKGRSAPPDRTFQGRVGTIPTTSAQNMNRFSIGLPVVHPLDRLHAAMGTAIAPDIQHLLSDYQFFWVQLACTFQAAEGYRFHNARFQVTFLTEPASGNVSTVLHSISPAIAYDLYPSRLEDEYSVNSKISITPELKLSCASVEAQVGLPAMERSTSGNAYRSRIEAFGLQDETSGWRFTSTDSHEISGAYRLYLLLRKPVHTQVKAVFQLQASVQRKGGTLQSLFMRYRNTSGELVDTPQYTLC